VARGAVPPLQKLNGKRWFLFFDYAYQPPDSPFILTAPASLSGSRLLPGFMLDLSRISGAG
jgi:hypothetical protein